MIFRTAVYANRTYGGVRGTPHRLQAVRLPTRLGVVKITAQPFLRFQYMRQNLQTQLRRLNSS